MSVKLIAENILTADDFSSATEQEGEHIDQPIPNSGNTGDFRLLSSGDITDFSYSGTTTSDGAVDGTTVIDSALTIYGDDYFIDGTVTISEGPCIGEERAITDFAQTTGTITTAAFSAQITVGIDFILTVAFATRDFRVELIGAGDAGDATFKWSHDGGTIYLGRDDPNQAAWLATKTVIAPNDVDPVNSKLDCIQADNGDLLVLYEIDTGTSIKVIKSTNRGRSWGSPISVADGSVISSGFVKLVSGRLQIQLGTTIYYSDDNGDAWTTGIAAPVAFDSRALLVNGNIIGIYVSGSDLYCRVSSDNAASWSDAILITTHQTAPHTEDIASPAVIQAANGNIVVVYESDIDVDTEIELKGKLSTDGGSTWGSLIDVMDIAAGKDLTQPRLLQDINKRLYCLARRADDKDLVLAYSDDYGASWNSATYLDLTSPGLANDVYGAFCLVDNHQAFCAYADGGLAGDIYSVRRGIWEAYSANACPCAIETQEQKLICDIAIAWHGGSGETSNPDKWSFTPDYSYSMKNLIEDSPSKSWRSEQDNINPNCAIVIDMGANEVFRATGIGLFDCNFRKCYFQMNATDSWGSPSVDELISFDVATGTVDAVSGNEIQDTSLLANYKDHALEEIYLRMTSGTDNNVTWKIRDNVGDYIYLETTASTNIAATDTFVIFQSNIAKTFTGGGYRFLRLNILNQQTADDYYQIGSMVVGQAITLSDDFSIGYGKTHRYDIDMIRTPHGGMIPIKGADRKRIFELNWQATSDTQEELVAVIDYVEGKNIVLIPDHSDLTDCYLVKHIGDLRQRQRYLDYFDVTLTFEEIL